MHAFFFKETSKKPPLGRQGEDGFVILIQFNSGLLMCRINSQMANYRSSTTNKHKLQWTRNRTSIKLTLTNIKIHK
jgi:hypothetical protein